MYRILIFLSRFKVKAGKLFETVVMFADFLLGQQEKYLKWPPVEERLVGNFLLSEVPVSVCI